MKTLVKTSIINRLAKKMAWRDAIAMTHQAYGSSNGYCAEDFRESQYREIAEAYKYRLSSLYVAR